MIIPEWIFKLRGLLDGKKTYLAALASICTGLINNDWNMVLVGLNVFFLRNAVAKD